MRFERAPNIRTHDRISSEKGGIVMGRITLKDYDKTTCDKGGKIYCLSDSAKKKHSKKELAGIPKTITVHKPDDDELIVRALAESACKVLAKQFGVDQRPDRKQNGVP